MTHQDFDTLPGTCPSSIAGALLATLAAALLGLFANPAALVNALNGLPVHPLVEAAIAWAEAWQSWCTDIGALNWFDGIRAAVQHLREWAWRD